MAEREWREFSGLIREQSKAKPMQSLFIFKTQNKISKLSELVYKNLQLQNDRAHDICYSDQMAVV